MRQAVLRLALSQPMRHCRNKGCQSAKITFPFKVLADFSTQRCEMVGLTVEESNLLFETLQDWDSQLAQHDPDDLRCGNENFSS
jgi:hypothetical protein